MDSMELKTYSTNLLSKISDGKTRAKARKSLKKHSFNPDQVSALIPDQRKSEELEIIRKEAQNAMESENGITRIRALTLFEMLCKPVETLESAEMHIRFYCKRTCSKENCKHIEYLTTYVQKPYKSIPKDLREYGVKHAFRAHGGKKSTLENLKCLSKIALRQKSDRLNAGDNYAIGDTESEDFGPKSDSENTSSPVHQTLSSQPKNDDYNPFKEQIAEIDLMLADPLK
ncbi:9442_t:CDS:2 [Funneliformis mosseae]|uniref:9442_t:CDS:1 n=1 Tax=Funneliformis mosseae TaxID=27381 RepID=A0A9N9DHE5_FUNMO|nr:9442_t:CDS:2 [Funneliformis mosseae]